MRANPALNAVIILDIEGAEQRAREADAALARGEIWEPLHGVPFTLKDAHATAGMRTTTGFPSLADTIPHVDSPVTARLKAAGGILMGEWNGFFVMNQAFAYADMHPVSISLVES